MIPCVSLLALFSLINNLGGLIEWGLSQVLDRKGELAREGHDTKGGLIERGIFQLLVRKGLNRESIDRAFMAYVQLNNVCSFCMTKILQNE